MTIKFNKSAGSWLSAPDNAAFTLPNGDWAIGFVLQLDGDQTNANAEYILSNAPFAVSGSLQIAYRTAASSANASRVVLYYGTTSTVRMQSAAAVTSGAHLFVVQRSGTSLSIKQCAVLASAPTDGSAVQSTSIAAPSTALDGAGMVIGNRQDLPSDRLCDQSIGRVFMISGALTDLEIARLAYGEEITGLGKTPAFYVRLNDIDDLADQGPNAIALAKSGTPTTSSTQPAFGYVPPGVAPTISGTPAIIGEPQVGTASSYTPAPATGTPTPTRTQQWLLDGSPISGATNATYTPVAGDVGKALSVRQTATNGSGAVSATSTGATVAAAPSNTVDGAELPAERIYQRASGTATIALSGTYSGTAPTSIEYQLYAADGATVLQSWAAIPGATIGGGTWSGTAAIPQGGMYRIRYQAKNGTSVIGSSVVKTNLFGVGDLIVCLGSSSAERMFLSSSGVGFTPAANVRKFDGTWATFGTDGSAIAMANSMAAQAGVPIGMLDYGEGGTYLTDWLNTSGTEWTALKNGINAAGGKLAAGYITVGSNDAAVGTVTSRASHLANLRQLVSNLRAHVSQASLPILLSGMNRRTSYTVPAGTYTQQANAARMAENDLGDDPNIYHVQTLDLLLSGDGIHLASASAGFPTSATRSAYVLGGAMYAGTYRRGPKISGFTFQGSAITATLTHRGGSDFTPTSGITGFSASDASGALTLAPVVRTNATTVTITTDRAIVAPLTVQYLSGGAPAVGTPVFSNGATPLPMTVETELAAVEGAPPVDEAPTLTGAIAAATGSTTASGGVTTNEAGGTLYWLFSTSSTATAAQVKAGGSKEVTVTGAQNVTGSGLTASTQYYLHLLHRDSAGQDSLVATSASFATLGAGATVTGVIVNPATAIVASGLTLQLTATVLGTSSPSQDVTWARIPAVGSVSNTGLFTAPIATDVAQSITITATSQQDPNFSASATITIPAVVVVDPEAPDERNYTWLQAEVLDWLQRNDPAMPAKVPKFITMAEARINRIVHARGMEIETTLTFGPGIGAVRLPTGFDTPLAAWIDCPTGRRALSGVVAEQLSGTTQRGEPQYWAISGAYLAIDCPPDHARKVTLRYRGLLRLSDAAPNNSVLTKYPDVYLYGTLMEAALWLRDQESLSTWSQLFDASMKELNLNESRSRANAPLRTELADLLGCR